MLRSKIYIRNKGFIVWLKVKSGYKVLADLVSCYNIKILITFLLILMQWDLFVLINKEAWGML